MTRAELKHGSIFELHLKDGDSRISRQMPLLVLCSCSFSVLNLATRLSFESGEEGAGGEKSLQNCEF